MPKPNARGKVALFIIAAIIFLVVGFVCGQIVKALTTLPGDKDDPVVTQSYVEAQIGSSLAALTTRIEELEAELAALKGAREAIRRWHPRLMIAGYHKTWDFWEVPERMLEAGYTVYLRSYMHHLSFVFYGC